MLSYRILLNSNCILLYAYVHYMYTMYLYVLILLYITNINTSYQNKVNKYLLLIFVKFTTIIKFRVIVILR